MNDELQRVEPLLSQFLMERYWATPWSKERELPENVWKSLNLHVKQLSDAFTTSRENFTSDYFKQKEARSAYLLYFHLANVMRNSAVLSNMMSARLLPRRPLRIMDLGSGLGSVAWSFLYAMKQEKLNLAEVILVDQDQKILEDSAKLYAKLTKENILPEVPHKYLNYDLANPHQSKKLIYQGPCDVIMSSNMLNEMIEAPLEELTSFYLKRINEQLADDGLLVIVEPAMMQTSRTLTLLRDSLLASGGVHTPMPCMHHGPCPLNNEPRDWCHFEVDWHPPSIRKRLEDTLEHGSGTLKYSYVVFQKGKKPVAKKNRPYRVISDILSSTQGYAVILCEPEKKISLELGLNSFDIPKKLQNLKRGDLFHAPIEKAPQKHQYATSARLKNISHFLEEE